MTQSRFKTALAFTLFVIGAVPAFAQTVPQSREQVQMSFAPVVKQVSPAVVNIYTRKVVRTVSPMFADPFFRQFFGNQMGLPQERVQRSLGSGVIVKADGTVVTNNHVIRDSDEITVVLADRREFEATVVGADERTDLAVLKINTGDQSLPVLPLGDSDALEVGDLVLAIGNPFGVGQTVTMGIVSALARTAVGGADYRSFIQTDAAINPGNSGGALVDLQGRLIGVNSAIYSSGQGGGSIGIGFAIPSTMVKAVLTNITSGGKAVRPWLGATGQAVTSEMFQALQLNRPIGVLINGVQAGSPAEQAGIKVGDVVVSVNGHEVDDPEALRFRIATLTVGTSAQMTVSRGGQERTVTAKLQPPPDTPPRDTSEISGHNPFSGATVANMNPALAEEMGLSGVEPGVTIIQVKRGTIANHLQFQPGDAVVKLNGRTIGSVADLKAIVGASAKSWAITIRRSGETFTLTVGN
ncbi:Do family serine endopeptidase [Telmatospirillum sp.]|uniref:Do family serine endopeptidase n=1 Tax=Telmatospirillum sp. TaxID=2079197 RepID=UPI00284FA57B|nr:Do family serine endopeptidase [Telmatospirillum sp.]MDR3439250.1 Do family serine endopeptidase [Telmatospirillum sp.]